ncbi:hypothetical protein NE237_020590 [Protea cynaroides]|uniref:Uncharacterized protein n=1 Tax=Protea cynaroides TaxID=273540 RepID=A0A9Q0K3K7_9MAGN|nr:hypothetical protein NE237_020590 [Protea cynaroides]
MTPFTEAGNRTHMLVGGGGRGRVSEEEEKKKSGNAVLVAEVASPISSRPPATAPSSGNFNGFAPVFDGFEDDDALAKEEVERGLTDGNRWPRQETLALLKIRLEMDVAFRDATLKGPLWEDISRYLKFPNTHIIWQIIEHPISILHTLLRLKYRKEQIPNPPLPYSILPRFQSSAVIFCAQ